MHIIGDIVAWQELISLLNGRCLQWVLATLVFQLQVLWHYRHQVTVC